MARYLAIDWDQNQLHVISAEVTKNSVRVKRAMVWQESRVPNLGLAEDLGKFLRDKLREGGFTPAPVLACVGRDRMIVKEIRFPAVPEAEEPAVVRFQTVKELTDAPDDVVIDYVKNGVPIAGEQKASALIVRREMLEAYRAVCEVAGLKLAGLVPRSIGVVTCLRKVMGTTVITPYPTPRDGVIAVVSLGERYAEISIIKDETFLLTRSLNVGPLLAGEIRRNLTVHAGQQPHLPVVGVYLTGQGSGELRQQLSDMIEQQVYVFDPFAWAESVEFADDPPPVKTSKTSVFVLNVQQETDVPRTNVANRGTFAGPMGLLFQKAAPAEMPVNFVSPRQPKPPGNPNYRLIRLGVVAAVVLFVGMIVMGRVLHASASDELTLLKQEMESLETQLKSTKENARRIEDINRWDTAVWLDEFYELGARIADVNRLRITELSAEPLQRSSMSKDKKQSVEDKAVAKMTIKGKLVDRRNGSQPLDKMIDEFRADGYRVRLAEFKNSEAFTLEVFVERRAPEQYQRTIQIEEVAAARPTQSEEANGKAEANGEDEDDFVMPPFGAGKAKEKGNDGKAINAGDGGFGGGEFGKGKAGGRGKRRSDDGDE